MIVSGTRTSEVSAPSRPVQVRLVGSHPDAYFSGGAAHRGDCEGEQERSSDGAAQYGGIVEGARDRTRGRCITCPSSEVPFRREHVTDGGSTVSFE
jgi:hypothetical protein